MTDRSKRRGDGGVDVGAFRPVARSSPIPLYWQIEDDLRRKIQEGMWPPGARLPSEQELGQLYRASRITIRQALGNIAADGLVSREPGRGTFVHNSKLTSAARVLASFTEEMMRLGYDIQTRIVTQRIEPANALVAGKLGIGVGEPVHRLDRLRFADGEPLALQRAHLPGSRFPGLESADLSGSLYAFLEERFDARPTTADELIQVTSLGSDREAVRLLETRPSQCAFLLERLTFDRVGTVDFTRSLVRGDRYQIRHGIQNPNNG